MAAYHAWVKDVPDNSERTDWLIDALKALQANTVSDPKPVTLPQIQTVVRKVAAQFSSLVSYSILLPRFV